MGYNASTNWPGISFSSMLMDTFMVITLLFIIGAVNKNGLLSASNYTLLFYLCVLGKTAILQIQERKD